MASESFIQHLGDHNFTSEEQWVIFNPSFNWESPTKDDDLTIIGKIVSTKNIDWQALIRVFQSIWKNDIVVSILMLKTNYFRFKLSSVTKRKKILKRRPWTFKNEWLALSPFDLKLSIDEYTFTHIRIWVRVHSIPTILMANDQVTDNIGRSLGFFVGTDTCYIDGNLVDYSCRDYYGCYKTAATMCGDRRL
ncbi:hypothetical protein HRI_002226600 [Hibiscus trionum]|uniref:DUF4283 domain-containing protein n=1 Tax=Hibiscus trionum TaxID=183268 RepID=A0A9W7HY55_HIBTR|nr:hypothetical protein HRI_002226600 [Hibiscus trionum]